MHILHDNEHATPVDDEARRAFGAWCENMAKNLLARLERTAGARVMMCGDVGEQARGVCDACEKGSDDTQRTTRAMMSEVIHMAMQAASEMCDAARDGVTLPCPVCDDATCVTCKAIVRLTGEQTKKVGGGSALSHARDSHGVCDTPDAKTHTHTSDASSRTHTNTHTDDATHCKHDTCDG